MLARVLKSFRDKHTKELYVADTVIDVSKKRFAEIEKNLGAGFVKESEAETPSPDTQSEEISEEG